MAIPSGLSAQLGIAEEVTYGTPVTVTKFFEFTQEKMALSIERLESKGLRSGTRVQRSDRWAPGQKSVSGSIEMELLNKGMGIWLKHAMGGVATAQPNAATAPTVYEHTFTPGDFPTGLTVQIGRTGVDGTTRAFTYSGCRVSEFEIAAQVGEIGSLSVNLLGRDESTATALATASYPTGSSLFTFVHGALSVAGTSVPAKSFSLSGKNAMDDKRYFLGSPLRSAPLENGFREYTGKIEPEFTDVTLYNRFVNGTEGALTLFFTGGNIASTYNYALEITANVRFDGDTPNVSGTDVIQNPMPFKCVGDTASSALSIVYRTTDTTP